MILKFKKSTKNENQFISHIKTEFGSKVVLPNYQIKQDSLYEVVLEEKERYFSIKSAELYEPFVTIEIEGDYAHITSLCGIDLRLEMSSTKDHFSQICNYFYKSNGMFKFCFTEESLFNLFMNFLEKRKKLAKKLVFEKVTTIFLN